MALRIFLKQFWLGLKLYTRIPAAIFWVFLFPIAMLVGLGLVFGDGGAASAVKLVWAQEQPSAADNDLLAALGERGLKIEVMTPAAAALWQEGKLAALLEGDGGHYRLKVNSYLAAQGMRAESLAQQAWLIAQARAQGVATLERMPVLVASPGGHHGGPYAAFLLPGLIGLSLLTMGIFSTGMIDVTMRANGGYKRLATTPLPRWIYLASQSSVRILIQLIANALLLAVGAAAFGISNQGSYIALLLLVLLGAACFISLGYLLASFARTVESYNGVANLVFMPTMLLSGVYFSLDQAPGWMQKITAAFPLSQLLRAMRAVFNDGAGLASQSTALAILALWTVVLFLSATRRFRWV